MLEYQLSDGLLVNLPMSPVSIRAVVTLVPATREMATHVRSLKRRLRQ